MKRAFLTCAGLALLSCCAKETDPGPPVAPRTPVSIETQAPLPDGHPDLPGLRVRSRGVRRVSVDQLEHSLDVLGRFPAGTVVLPESLALTLGRPDYLTVTEESLEPTPLFMKFMVDLGMFFCDSVAGADLSRPVSERVLTRYADRDRNLRSLLLRFTGIDGPEADPYVARLAEVYESAKEAPRGTIDGWVGVCLALFTSPEFLLY